MGCSVSAASPAIAQAPSTDQVMSVSQLEAPPIDNCTIGHPNHLEISVVAESTISAVKQNVCYSVYGCDDFFSKYLLGVKLGAGAFAQVRVGVPIDDPRFEEVAVKIIKLRTESSEERGVAGINNEKALKLTYAEEMIWKTVGRHKNCVKLLETFHGKTFSYFVMEKCSSSLPRHIYCMPQINERTLGQLFVGMLHGLAHVHSVNVVHRDVKPDNFLIGQDGRTVKLSDFGLSRSLSARKKSELVGTAPYMCPEMIREGDYDGRADVWSVGVIVYTFLFGVFPYMSEEGTSAAMLQAILVGDTPAFVPVGGCSDQAKDDFRTDSSLSFVKALLARNIEARPTVAKALKMKFMRDIVDDLHEEWTPRLPSLRPMIKSAKKLGAFGDRHGHRRDEVDSILNDLQEQSHGLSIFHTQEGRYMAVPSHSTPPIQINYFKGATQVSARKCSDCSTSCASGSLSPKAFSRGLEWSGENSNYRNM